MLPFRSVELFFIAKASGGKLRVGSQMMIMDESWMFKIWMKKNGFDNVQGGEGRIESTTCTETE
jgi:hypothetical protein